MISSKLLRKNSMTFLSAPAFLSSKPIFLRTKRLLAKIIPKTVRLMCYATNPDCLLFLLLTSRMNAILTRATAEELACKLRKDYKAFDAETIS